MFQPFTTLKVCIVEEAHRSSSAAAFWDRAHPRSVNAVIALGPKSDVTSALSHRTPPAAHASDHARPAVPFTLPSLPSTTLDLPHPPRTTLDLLSWHPHLKRGFQVRGFSGSGPKTHWGMRLLDKMVVLPGVTPTIQRHGGPE